MRMKPGRPSGAGARRSPMGMVWPGPVQAGGLVAGLAAQVVQVRYREAREPLVAWIAKELPSALQQPFRGRPGEGAMQRIGLREQLHVSGAELPAKPALGAR